MNRAAFASGWRRWWPFALLCVVSVLRLALSENLPQVMPTMPSLAAASFVCCSVWCGVLLAQRRHFTNFGGAGRALLAGTCLLCGPVVALFFRTNDLAGSDLLLAGSLVPVVVAIGVAATGFGGGLSMATLWPGLAASAALLLLFPEPRVHTIAGAMVLVLLPVLTGVGASMMATGTREDGAWFYPLALFGACLAFLLASFAQRASLPTFPWPAFVFDVISIPCTLLSLERIGAMRYSAFFVVVPLCVLLYGLLLLRPAVNVRMLTGLVLLVGSAVGLLLHRSRNSQARSLGLLE